MSEKLKPCPFCGSNNLEFKDSDIEGWISHVACMSCDDMIGPMSEFKYDDVEEAHADAANVWNRRHQEQDPSSTFERWVNK